MTPSKSLTIIHSIVERPGRIWEDILITAGITLFPLLYMTYRGWTNKWLITLFALSLFFFINQKHAFYESLKGKSTKLMLVVLMSPFLAILFSQILRNDISINAYDGPLRFALAAPIFLYLKYKKINFLQVFQFIAPLSLVIAVAAIIYHPETSEFWRGRFATYFVDPLTFGGYALIIGFTCLFQLKPQKDSYLLTALKLTGFACALFLSLGSGSRSGWIAIPFLLALWIFLNRHDKKLVYGLSITIVITITLILTFNEPLQLRIMSIFQEAYSWFTNQANKENGSGGIRLSMWKISIMIFLKNPLLGFGSIENYRHFLHDPMITSQVGEIAITSINNGPHNEVLALMLRAGLFGLISGLLLFFGPLYIFIKQLKEMPKDNNLHVGICFVLGIFICSLNIEVFNLKYTSSFYAMMLACIGAQALSLGERNAS